MCKGGISAQIRNHLYKTYSALLLFLYFCFMEVNDALVQKLANLAKLRFNENEAKSIQVDLERMIQFVQKMEEVNTDAVVPLLHMSASVNIGRKDAIAGTCQHDAALMNAGKHDHQFFLVPKVIKK